MKIDTEILGRGLSAEYEHHGEDFVKKETAGSTHTDDISLHIDLAEDVEWYNCEKRFYLLPAETQLHLEVWFAFIFGIIDYVSDIGVLYIWYDDGRKGHAVCLFLAILIANISSQLQALKLPHLNSIVRYTAWTGLGAIFQAFNIIWNSQGNLHHSLPESEIAMFVHLKNDQVGLENTISGFIQLHAAISNSGTSEFEYFSLIATNIVLSRTLMNIMKQFCEYTMPFNQAMKLWLYLLVNYVCNTLSASLFIIDSSDAQLGVLFGLMGLYIIGSVNIFRKDGDPSTTLSNSLQVVPSSKPFIDLMFKKKTHEINYLGFGMIKLRWLANTILTLLSPQIAEDLKYDDPILILAYVLLAADLYLTFDMFKREASMWKIYYAVRTTFQEDVGDYSDFFSNFGGRRAWESLLEYSLKLKNDVYDAGHLVIFARLRICDHKYPDRAWVDGYYDVDGTNRVLRMYSTIPNVRARIEILYFLLLEKFPQVLPDTFDRLLALDRKNFQIWGMYAWYWENKEDYEKSAERYTQALIHWPHNKNLLVNFSYILRKYIQDYERARDTAQLAADVDPSYPRAHKNLGLALQKLGEFENAKKCFRKCIDLDDKYDKAYVCLADIYEIEGDIEEAQRLKEIADQIKLLKKRSASNNSSSILHASAGMKFIDSSKRRKVKFDVGTQSSTKPKYLDIFDGEWFLDGVFKAEIYDGYIHWDKKTKTEIKGRWNEEISIAVDEKNYIGILKGKTLEWNDGEVWTAKPEKMATDVFKLSKPADSVEEEAGLTDLDDDSSENHLKLFDEDPEYSQNQMDVETARESSLRL